MHRFGRRLISQGCLTSLHFERIVRRRVDRIVRRGEERRGSGTLGTPPGEDLREQLGRMDNDGHEQLASQPAVTPIAVLDELLSKWDGSSPTTQELLHHASGASGDDHLEMKEIEPKDIDVILHQSGVDSSSFADEEDGQVSNGVAVERTEVESDLSSTIEHPVGDEIAESSHVWYACYGSNMYRPRFMCYIEGGKIEAMSRPCLGCRDNSPPVASEWLSIPNRLFFGHKGTRMWGSGGVAFIDPVPEPGVLTHVRIYKITMEQFNDVVSQENSGIVERNWSIGRHINLLKKTPHHSMEIFKGSWYGTVLYLGEKDGLPIFTFTCSESQMEEFRSGELETVAPSASYRSVIVHGLVEDLGLIEEQAHDYVSLATLPKTGVES